MSRPTPPSPRRALGMEGERRAARALETAGLRIVAMNARIGPDELDIIAQDGEMWVFAEVKTRRGGGYGAPDEAVTPAKQAKLLRAARAWMEAHGIEDADWRFDVVAVRFQDGAPPNIEIIPNAFGD